MKTMIRDVFVIGDSISIHYGPYLKKMISSKFSYDRKRGLKEALNDLNKPIGANAGDSKMVLDYLIEEHLNEKRHDILIINCGMHDIRVDRNTHKINISEDDYSLNLNKIIDIGSSISNKVIWIDSTPIIDEVHNSRKEGFFRYSKDVERYNEIAREVMIEKEISIIGLHDFTKSLGDQIYQDHVHFKKEVSELQAAFISGYLNNL